MEKAGWWVEGSAEYFAHLAAPGAGGQDWIDAFDADSRRLGLTEMAYQNVVFFAGIGHAGGPTAVGGFLARMQPGDQLAVLRGLVPQSDWIGFVESWLDGQITLPGGQPIIPAPLATGNKVSTASGELTLAARPYLIDRWGASFAEGRRFDLTRSTTDAGHMAMKLLNTADPWADPPEKINTCDGEQQHIVYLTATDGDTEARISVTTVDDGAGEDTSAGTCCLIGAWSPTRETLDGFATTAMGIGGGPIAAAGGNLSCGYASGGWVLRFNEAGDGSIDYQANTTTCTVSGRGGNMRFEESRSGSIGFDWAVTGEGAGMATYTENTLQWSLAIHIGPMVQNQGGPDAGPSLRSNGFAFSCEADALTIRGLYGLSTAEATYLRFEE